MKPKKIWANLSVHDLEKTSKFYGALGFKPNGNGSGAEGTSFFFGKDEFVINFFTKKRFDIDINGMASGSTAGSEIIFSLSAETQDEVNKCAEEVRKIGGTIISEPKKFGEGYTFAFADPDGHKFNVLYWPGMD